MTSPTFSSEIVVKPIDAYGGDWLFADAARVSSGHEEGSGPRVCQGNAKDEGLIKSLVRQRHGGPFGHGGLTFFVEAPIFVFREWRTHRIYTHQTTDDMSYSEASARYRPMAGKFWLPSRDRPLITPEGYKPMRPVFERADDGMYAIICHGMTSVYDHAWDQYERLIRAGTAPEVARAILGTGAYSAMYVSVNPRSLSHFLSLRTHEPDAMFVSYPQLEIEEAARALEVMFAEGWPVTYNAWQEAGRHSL